MGVSVLSVVGTIAGVVTDISGGSAPTNEADDVELYNLAIQGDALALANLATVSGQAGQAAGIPGALVPSTWSPAFLALPRINGSQFGPQATGGWGSAAAQADAVTKYQQAQTYLAAHPTTAFLGLFSGTTGELLLFGGIGLALVVLIQLTV